MRPKGMEDLAAFSAREVKRAAAEERERATARGAMEKGGCVRVIEGEEVRGDDPLEYFLPTGVGRVPLESQRG